MKLYLESKFLMCVVPLFVLVIGIGSCYVDVYQLDHNYVNQPYLNEARASGSSIHSLQN